jgi:hypothetical protein
MVFVRARTLALLAALSASNVNAFSIPKIASVTTTTTSSSSSRTPGMLLLRMAEGDSSSESSEGTTFVPSVLKKEIAYDEKSGRFYETGFGEGECIPDEEFCYLDKESGESIRLTVEEKERIFLDALQVRDCVENGYIWGISYSTLLLTTLCVCRSSFHKYRHTTPVAESFSATVNSIS